MNGKEVSFVSSKADPGAESDYDSDAPSSETDAEYSTNISTANGEKRVIVKCLL
jgi:hypothetical protein